MTKGRFSEAQIVSILQQQQVGQTVAQTIREHSINEATIYSWKQRCGGSTVSELTSRCARRCISTAYAGRL